MDMPASVTVDCDSENDFDGRIGLRVSAIFVILVTSFFGAVFPVFAKRNQGVHVPEWAFFVAKYFGSGVIIATAFIHLLAPANEALTSPCLSGPITEYPWVEGIALMTVFMLFFVELMAMRAASGHSHHSHDDQDDNGDSDIDAPSTSPSKRERLDDGDEESAVPSKQPLAPPHRTHSQMPGEDHLGHSRQHVSNSMTPAEAEAYAAQLTSVFILEFGVVFHSIFIGLTLAVAGSEFVVLYIVLVFHQTFEGLGLGTRLAATPWPATRRWTPYIMGAGYAISTPVAIAAGLGVRNTYEPGGATALLVNGIFDSISAGILIYTGLVELMAHEFMFSETMRKAPLGEVLAAFGLMCLGAALMALLGKWA